MLIPLNFSYPIRDRGYRNPEKVVIRYKPNDSLLSIHDWNVPNMCPIHNLLCDEDLLIGRKRKNVFILLILWPQ
jgi:hypothetical protein